LSARAWLKETQEAINTNLGPVSEGKMTPDWDVLRMGLLACTHAAQSTRHVVDVIHNTAGTTASRMDSPLERRLRDAHQAATHAAISYRHYGNLGATFLGNEPPPNFGARPRD
jgi:Acyl-CoA dehydrogenase, C-terminal domain